MNKIILHLKEEDINREKRIISKLKIQQLPFKITQENYGHWIQDEEQKLKDQEDMENVKWY